ncbi:hypothetical protein Prudu_013093 [Prunus dulcis]|uniref:Uncharacterized protein n=1 Tax=Prunus dulcis TaxID=3755 RepID=A0A4Y1RF36_PRUDU|nr:hypothetical protein Prudu_013093 [Prunus dulcis]
MAFSVYTTPSTTSSLHLKQAHYFPLFTFHFNQLFPLSVSFPTPSSTPTRLHISVCAAAKSQTGPVKKRSPSGTNNNKKKKRKGGGGGDSEDLSLSDVEIVDNLGASGVGSSGSGSSSRSLGFHPTPLPKPPAGFVVDDHGKVLMASSKRIASIPVQILKSTNIDGWSAVCSRGPYLTAYDNFETAKFSRCRYNILVTECGQEVVDGAIFSADLNRWKHLGSN